MDIHIFLNSILFKTYYKNSNNFFVYPHVGEYVLINSLEIDDEELVKQLDDEFDEEGNIELQVTKVLHDFEYEILYIYTKTKHRIQLH